MKNGFCVIGFRKAEWDTRVFPTWDEANRERKRLQRRCPEIVYLIEEVTE